jgi:hypothetical protein
MSCVCWHSSAITVRVSQTLTLKTQVMTILVLTETSQLWRIMYTNDIQPRCQYVRQVVQRWERDPQTIGQYHLSVHSRSDDKSKMSFHWCLSTFILGLVLGDIPRWSLHSEYHLWIIIIFNIYASIAGISRSAHPQLSSDIDHGWMELLLMGKHTENTCWIGQIWSDHPSIYRPPMRSKCLLSHGSAVTCKAAASHTWSVWRVCVRPPGPGRRNEVSPRSHIYSGTWVLGRNWAGSGGWDEGWVWRRGTYSC